MTKPNCVIVRAYGRQLDQLRSEASRMSKGRKILVGRTCGRRHPILFRGHRHKESVRFHLRELSDPLPRRLTRVARGLGSTTTTPAHRSAKVRPTESPNAFQWA